MDISEDVIKADGQQIPVEFTYSVTWRESTVSFDKRMDKYRRYQFLPQHLEVIALVACPECRSLTFYGLEPVGLHCACWVLACDRWYCDLSGVLVWHSCEVHERIKLLSMAECISNA